MAKMGLLFNVMLGDKTIRCIDLEYFVDDSQVFDIGIILDDMIVFGLRDTYTEGDVLRLLDRLEPLPEAFCLGILDGDEVGYFKYVPMSDLGQLFMRQVELTGNYAQLKLLVEARISNLPEHIMETYMAALKTPPN
jgi:hypothetical protein